jgi:nucleoid-associated protein YgaU
MSSVLASECHASNSSIVATIYPPGTDVGWFGSKLARSVGRAVSGAAKQVGKAATKVSKVAAYVPGVGPVAAAALKVGGAGLQGKNMGRAAKSAASTLGRQAVMAGKVASYVPGVGTAVGAGLKVYGNVLQGQNVATAAFDAAKNASPYVQMAATGLNAARDIASGKNVLRSVADRGMNLALANVPGGEYGRAAAQIALAGARGQNVLRAAGNQVLSVASRAVPLPVSRETIQSLASARQQLGATMNVLRPGVLRPNLSNFGAQVVRATRPNFGRAATLFGVGHTAMSPMSRAFLRQHGGRFAREVSGLTTDGKWLVQKGDTGSSIAKALTGNANRWTELKAVNPTIMKARAAQVAKYGFPIYVGDLINLPAGWVKPTVAPTITPAPTQVTTPTVAPSVVVPTVEVRPIPTVIAPTADLAAMGAARATLLVWAKSDGANMAGVTDYGTLADASSPSWTARDALQAASFEAYLKGQGRWAGVTDGQWSQALADELRLWAERKAAQVVPVTPAKTTTVTEDIPGRDPISRGPSNQTPNDFTIPTPAGNVTVTVPTISPAPSGGVTVTPATVTPAQTEQPSQPSFWSQNKASLISTGVGVAAAWFGRKL